MAPLTIFYAAGVVFGFAYGGIMPLYAILVREYFGARIMGLFIASSAIGAGAVAIALTFRPPRAMSLMLPSQRHRSLTTAELIRVK